jgi:flagellar protein FlaI
MVLKAYRILTVNEVVDFDRTSIYWDPIRMINCSFESSELLPTMALKLGVTTEELVKELYRRKDVLHYMREKEIRSYGDVSAIIAEYYARPKEFYEKIIAGEEVKPLVTIKNA